MFHIQTLFMYKGQISSCVIDECVRVYTASTLQRVQLLERLCQTGRHQTTTDCSAPLCAAPPGSVWQRVAAKRRRRGVERGICRWQGRQTERKTRLVTQLREVAVCRLIGYTACMVQFVCGVHFYMCSSYVEQNSWMCGDIGLPVCCSTSRRLSGEIRSQASLSPLLPSSSPFSPLLLSACPLVLFFFYLSAPAHILTLSPATDSS